MYPISHGHGSSDLPELWDSGEKDEFNKRERNASNGNVHISGPYRRDVELHGHFCTGRSRISGDAKAHKGTTQAFTAGRKDATG